ATVRGGGEEHEVPLAIVRKAFQELETLLSVLMCADAGVSFVDDDQGRAGPGETLATAVGLDVVETDDSVGIGIEQGLRRREIALQAGCRGRSDGNSVQVE